MPDYLFKKHQWFLLLLLMLVCVGPSSASKAIAVIVPEAAAFDELDRQAVADIFLSEGNSDYKNITVFDRTDFALKGPFYRHIAGMSLNRLRAFWAKKVFTSRGRPPKTIVEVDQMRFMERNRNRTVMTYIDSNKLPDNYKVVYRFNTEE